jgi:hypothetical protein
VAARHKETALRTPEVQAQQTKAMPEATTTTPAPRASDMAVVVVVLPRSGQTERRLVVEKVAMVFRHLSQARQLHERVVAVLEPTAV